MDQTRSLVSSIPSLDGAPTVLSPPRQEAWLTVSAAAVLGFDLASPRPAPSFLESVGSLSSGQ